MAEELEHPNSADDLYLAGSMNDVVRARPILTGDIFNDIEIPGLDAGGRAIVLTHPCSMRTDGVHLANKLLMARVIHGQAIPLTDWSTKFFKICPLPEVEGEQLQARFDEIGLVKSESVAPANRIACMSPYGINLLQQRLIWHLTRFVVPTHRLNEACAAVFFEAELCEEWTESRLDAGTDVDTAHSEFHDWIRVAEGGVMRQSQLEDPQMRASVRRQMRSHLDS